MNKGSLVIIGLSLVFTVLVLLAISSGFDNDGKAYQGVKAPTSSDRKVSTDSKIQPEASVSTPKKAAESVENKVNVATPVKAIQTDKPVAEKPLYSVIDGNKLDANSYAGFKLFRNWCARCHGTYGQGLVGPNLAERLKVLTKEEFFSTVENGKTGQIGNMPAWKNNMKVMQGRDKLYAYLKARSDGAIGEVKPRKQ